jgi:hypothetical protein
MGAPSLARMRSERFFRLIASGPSPLTAAVLVISALEMVDIQIYRAKNNAAPQSGQAREFVETGLRSRILSVEPVTRFRPLNSDL